MADSMKNVPENELFSAYVDGELTAAEQAEVERLLAASPAARQLVDDLRALSSTLQSLPVRKLDVDLSREVLRLAEHRMLSGRGDSDADLGEPLPESGRWRAFVRRWTRPRIWVWPAVAVAVSLLLVVLQPEQGRREAPAPGEKIVALAPAAREPSEPPAIGALVEADSDRRLVEKAGIERAAAEAGEDKPGPASEGRGEVAKAPMAKSPAAASSAIADSAALSAPAAAPDAAGLSRKARTEATGQSLPAPAAMAESKEKAPDEVTIVYCDVAPEAIPFVEQVLAKRRIAMADAKDQRARAEPATRPEGEGKGVRSRPSDKPSGRALAIDARGVVCLQAEATPQQLEAVLADLRSQPELVRSLAQTQVAGPVADKDWDSVLRFAVMPALKQKGDSPAAESPESSVARRATKAAASPAEVSRKAFPAALQDRPAQAQSAGGKGAMSPPRDAPPPEATTTVAPKPSAANREPTVQSQSGAAARAEQQARNSASPAPQKAVETEPAVGARAAFRSMPAGAALAPQATQQAMEDKLTREFLAASPPEVKRRVVFVLRPVEGPDPKR